MKIFPLRPLSTLDRARNLLNIMSSEPARNAANKAIQNAQPKRITAPNYDKEINILGCHMSLKELREIYKDGLKRLSKH